MNGNPFAAHLEALDQKAGRVHTVDDWRRVGETSQYTPEALTEDDLVILAYFDGESSASRARARRTLARNPPSNPPAAAPPVRTKASEVPATPEIQRETTLEEFRKRYGSKAATVEMLLACDDMVGEELKAQKATIAELTARLDAQDAAIATLKAAPTLKDAGIWRHGSAYAPGDMAQFKGSPWVCTKAHTASGTPDHSCWRLLLKSHNSKDGVVR